MHAQNTRRPALPHPPPSNRPRKIHDCTTPCSNAGTPVAPVQGATPETGSSRPGGESKSAAGDTVPDKDNNTDEDNNNNNDPDTDAHPGGPGGPGAPGAGVPYAAAKVQIHGQQRRQIQRNENRSEDEDRLVEHLRAAD